MAQNITTENDSSVLEFLNGVESDGKKVDCHKIINIMGAVTGFEPKMWGTAIVGFGSYHYKYESGRTGDAPLVGFSPRKDAIALYFSPDFEDRETLLAKLGKHKSGKACVYVKNVVDIDVEVLKVIIKNSVESIKNMYP